MRGKSSMKLILICSFKLETLLMYWMKKRDFLRHDLVSEEMEGFASTICIFTTGWTAVSLKTSMPYLLPWSSYRLLGLWCGDDVLIKLWFLVICVFLFSWRFHIWFHWLRGLLLVVGALCTALWGETHRVGFADNERPGQYVDSTGDGGWLGHGEIPGLQQKQNLQQCWGNLRSQ